MAVQPVVDISKCEGCEECVSNCAIQIKDGKADPNQADLCEGCETCISVCSTGAVTLKEM